MVSIWNKRRRKRLKTKEPTEREIHEAVIDHWRNFGLPGTLVATIPNQMAFGQPGLTKGLPDLMIVIPGGGIKFIELKTKTGRLSKAQKEIHATLIAAGVDLAVTRGRDEPIEYLEYWGVVHRRAARVIKTY
jgi:hypothetical protein